MSFEDELKKTTNHNYHEETQQERYDRLLCQTAQKCALHFKSVCKAQALKGKQSVTDYATSTTEGDEYFSDSITTDPSPFLQPYINLGTSSSWSGEVKHSDRDKFIQLLYKELHALDFSNVTITTKITYTKVRVWKDKIKHTRGLGLFGFHKEKAAEQEMVPEYEFFVISTHW